MKQPSLSRRRHKHTLNHLCEAMSSVTDLSVVVCRFDNSEAQAINMDYNFGRIKISLNVKQ